MLFLFAAWLMLSALAAGIGLWVVGREFVDGMRTRTDAEDALFFAAWVGVALLAMAAQAVVLVTPLGPGASAILLGGAAGVATLGWRRALTRAPMGSAWRAVLPVLAVVGLLLAERSTPVGNLDDAGGYHWGMIDWYGEAGVPLGLSLFQWRFSTHSSWFAFSALFNHGPLESRIGNLANGLLLLWMLSYLWICGRRMFAGRLEAPVVFVFCAAFVVLVRMLGWDMRLSPSHDVPVILLCIVASWAWLRFRVVVAPRLLAVPLLLLCAFAVSDRLTGVPLLISGWVLVVWALRDEAARWKWALGLAALSAVPLVLRSAASVLSTGCVLFPFPALCFDVPWGVGLETARHYTSMAYEGADRNIDGWLAASGAGLAAVILAVRARRGETPNGAVLPEWGVVLIALAGIAFVLRFSPQLRYAQGYLAILPALGVACVAPRILQWLGHGPAALGRALRSVLAIVLPLALAQPLYKEFIQSKLRAREFATLAERKRGDPLVNAPNPRWWLLPNRVAYGGEIVPAKGFDFDYEISPQANCWNRGLLCASNPELSHIDRIRLRDAARGPRGGFVLRERSR